MTEDVEFLMFTVEEYPDKFMLIRVVENLATHYLDPFGVWVAWPDNDEQSEHIFTRLVKNGTLPKFAPTEVEDATEED
jgi:hypothetical protein